MNPRRIRLPLAVGLSSLNDLALGVLIIPIGLAVGGSVLWLCWEAQDVNEVTGAIIFIGFSVALMGVRYIRRAWRWRPSDVLLDEDALHIDGGRLHGHRHRFDTMNPSACKVVTEKADKESTEALVHTFIGSDETHRLMVGDVVLAEASDPNEATSLREIADAIRARIPIVEDDRVATPKDEKRHTDVALLACTKCGALVAPSEKTEVECQHCGERVTMPKEVLARVRAASELTKRSTRMERQVTSMLDQPGARSTTFLLALSAILIAGAWPVTTWAVVRTYSAHMLSVPIGLALATLPLMLVADGFFLSRLRMVDRRALGALTLTFAARPPATKGAPPSCRSCLAPLRDANATVVKCVFCGASNITGVDLRALAGRAKTSERSLEDAVDERSRQRTKWRLRTLASIPLFIATAAILYTTMGHTPIPKPNPPLSHSAR